MRFSFYINPQTPGPEDDGRIINEVLGQVDLAEQLGFDEVWLTEHHFSGYNAYSDPLMLAAAISQRNPSLRIGFSLAVVPLHHPVQFAIQANLLDQLSRGKFTLGIGPGNADDEFRGYGHEAADRHEMVDEFMRVLETAWNAPPAGFAYDGRFWQGTVKGRIIPSPANPPTIPIAWGTGTPATIEYIGSRGYSWLMAPFMHPATHPHLIRAYVQGMESAGLDAAARARAWASTGIMRQFYVATPGEDIEESIGDYITIYARESLRANFGIDDMPKDDFDLRRENFKNRWLAAGTADELVERFTPLAKLGVGHLMGWFTFGHIPDHLVRRSLERFAADVMPRLRAVQPDPDYLAEVVEAGKVAPAPAAR